MPDRAADTEPPDGPSAARRLLTSRVPLWSLVLAIVVVGGAGLAFAVARDIPSFGDAVTNSESVDVVVRMCNRQVDANDVNPRRAELDLEDELRSRGAGKASVTVQRRDCPTPSARP